MRTVRCSSHIGEGGLPRGVCPGGVSAQGGCLPDGCTQLFFNGFAYVMGMNAQMNYHH